MDSTQLKTLIALCREGKTRQEIGQALSLTPEQVTSHLYRLRRLGVSLPPRCRSKKYETKSKLTETLKGLGEL